MPKEYYLYVNGKRVEVSEQIYKVYWRVKEHEKYLEQVDKKNHLLFFCSFSENKVTSIKALGTGCKSCHDQYENVKKAIEELGLEIEVEYITDMEKVMAYGVMSMPAIVVNETVASIGKVLKSAEVIKLLGKLGF